jgi:hypothetical protein
MNEIKKKFFTIMGAYACLDTFTYIILSMKKRTLKQQKYTNNYALINYIYIYSNNSIFIFQDKIKSFSYRDFITAQNMIITVVNV